MGRDSWGRSTGSEWRETSLGSITKFLSGGTPSKGRATYWSGSVPWVSAKDMKRFRLYDTEDHVTTEGATNGTTLVPAGTVLLLVRGMTLLNDVPVCVTKQTMTFNQDVKALRPESGVDDDFLPYLLLGNKRRLLSLVDLAGHGTGRLNSEELRALDIQLPPEAEQRAIAHILGTLDDKIELSRRTNETLEEMARTLFKSWFIDFDPVHAKAALKRHAAAQITPPQGGSDWTVERARAYLDGMDPGIAALFPDRFVDSELGEVPEGWGETTLEKIAVLNPETWTARNAPKTVVYVDLSNTKWGTIEKCETHEWKDAPSRAKRVLRIGDTILGTVRPGNGSYAFIGEDGLTGSTGFAVLRPSLARDRAIVWCCATASENIDRLTHLADGAAYPAVRPQVVGATKIILPSERVRNVFATICDPLLDQMEANKRESRALAALRDTLLPKLISGAVRVRDPRRFLESVS